MSERPPTCTVRREGDHYVISCSAHPWPGGLCGPGLLR
jgi:hypothetical protein